METDKQQINSVSENDDDYLSENSSLVESSSANHGMEEKEIEKSASLLSLLTPQRKIKEFESKQSSIDKDLKDNLKMRSSILEDFNASLKSEMSTQKNSSLSFGALYSYLFES